VAEPLKNSFGPDIAERLGRMVAHVADDFDTSRFLALALDGYEELELTARARQISDAFAATLPEEPERAVGTLIDAVRADPSLNDLEGFASFLYLPLVFFIADHGLDCYEVSMEAQYELTQRFTAEFSIRAYLERYPERTLARLEEWASDPSEHVRRLVSEGTRPRLPWAPRLKRFQDDPAPVIRLLDMLKDDDEEYVRRSVANNLNDISRDHPDLVVEVARRWWKGASPERKKLIRRGLRTLVKAGHRGALDVLGYGADSPVTLTSVTCTPASVEIGGKVQVEVALANPSATRGEALVDLRAHFVKANGERRPKVFKGAEVELEPGEEMSFRRTISLRQHTTRKHYPGRHVVEVLLNGSPVGEAGFDLTGP